MIYNIKLLDFNTFFKEIIEKEIIDSLYVFKLFDENYQLKLRNPQVKNIIDYFIAFYICKEIKLHKNEKLVVTVQPDIINDTKIESYCDFKSLQNLIKKILKILKDTHPKNVIILKKPMIISNIDTIKYIFNIINSA